MNLWCRAGRHRWVTRQEMGETGHMETYEQCERCGHYPKTGHWYQGEGSEEHPLDTQGGAGGVSG